MLPRKRTIFDLFQALVAWLALGFSLGWYYVFTYYGRTGVPMPHPEALIALVLYYFSVQNVRTIYQALHWMAVFPIAGLLWVSTLSLTAPFFGGRRVDFSWTLLRFSMTGLPMVLPLPVVMYLAGRTEYEGFHVQHLVAVALRHSTQTPPQWLTPLYLVLGALALVWEILLYVKVFDIHGVKAWQHFIASAVLLVILACGVSTLVSFGLRTGFGLS